MLKNYINIAIRKARQNGLYSIINTLGLSIGIAAFLFIIQFAPFGVVPHWGKIFTINSSVLHSRYEWMNDFQQLAKKYDPEGKFRNAYLDLNVYN